MKIIHTDTREPNLSQFELEQIYCGLDGCITHECDEILESQHDEVSRKTYEFSLSMNLPFLLMMRRGVRVNPVVRQTMINDLSKEKAALEGWLNEMSLALWNRELNARSSPQLQELFYDVMKIQEVKKKNKYGVMVRTTDMEALDKIHERNLYARPLVNTILAIRDVSKTLGVVQSAIRDGRFYFQLNPVGTSTGRASSKKDVYGYGSNAQNLTKDVRAMFIPDEGMMLGACDLSQAESFAVAYITEDLAYMEACESGDLHTTCCKMIWPNLPWTGDLAKDKDFADGEKYFRHFTRRDLMKRGGHLSNYYGKPFTMHSRLKLPMQLCTNFQNLYFNRFPGIPRWWGEVQRTIMRDKCLTTAMGRRRWVFERLNSEETLRKFIAFEPQSIVADVINKGIRQVVYTLARPGYVEVLLQVHDCLVFQFPDRQYEVAEKVRQALKVPVKIKGRTMLIPADLKVGYDWKNMVSVEKADRLVRPVVNLMDMPIGT